jgi:hypothetical protein
MGNFYKYSRFWGKQPLLMIGRGVYRAAVCRKNRLLGIRETQQALSILTALKRWFCVLAGNLSHSEAQGIEAEIP